MALHNIYNEYNYCYMSKKSVPILYSKSLYKMGHHFLNIQYNYNIYITKTIASICLIIEE